MSYLKSFAISIFFILGLLFHSQAQESQIIKPILLDKEALSGVGLQKVEQKNSPERDFFQKRLYGGREISVYIVSSESWTAPFDAFWFDEFIYILHGKGVVHLENEEALFFNSGEYFFAPKGFSGKWEVQAGDNYHYELSVITNRRADSTKVSELKTPIHLDRSILSGTEISFDESELYSEVLADGIELDVRLCAEQPRSLEMSTSGKEQLICIQSGMINITDTSGEIHTFYTGDNFVLPHGFTGHWKSQGHSIVKYISVSAS